MPVFINLCVLFTILIKDFFWKTLTGLCRRSQWHPLQYSCLENPMDGGAWQAADHGVAKSWTQLSDFTFTFHFHPLEKEMATHSSVLAWRIPGTGSLVGCCLWGSTESDMTEATQQQQQQGSVVICWADPHTILLNKLMCTQLNHGQKLKKKKEAPTAVRCDLV